eukprot:637639-Amorphochlora_amoeboformis.AAC.1
MESQGGQNGDAGESWPEGAAKEASEGTIRRPTGIPALDIDDSLFHSATSVIEKGFNSIFVAFPKRMS